ANDLQQRTVARLKPDCDYKFRVRAINALGVSGWSEVVHARTKIDPKNGGGHAEGYTWEQTPSDITLMFELPPGTSKREVRLTLRQDWIRVELAPAASPAKCFCLCGVPIAWHAHGLYMAYTWSWSPTTYSIA
ncbi:uncharacterized protein HaLaN_10499, partial [Haematococcus lacustris]